MIEIPPHLKNKLEQIKAQINEQLPIAQAFAGSVKEYALPLWEVLSEILRNLSARLAAGGSLPTLGNTFRHICVVGLNRAELLVQSEQQSVFGDGWMDLADDTLKRHMAMVFFAPRGFDGQPANPYLFLMGEGTDAETDTASNTAIAQQAIGPIALLDYCRLPPAPANTVNILLAADMLFHWDVRDNYIFPTTPTGWVRDLETILKTYPRTTRAHIYTQWDTEIMPPNDRITVHPLRNLPLEDSTWINQPTLQEKLGGHVLLFGLIVAGLIYGGLWYKQRELQTLTDEFHVIEQQIPRGGEFSDLEKAIEEQEKMFKKRELFALIVKDTARAIQRAGMRINSFETRVPDPTAAPKQYLTTIEATPGVYQGWLQEEPIARQVLLNSTLIDAIRKPPAATGFKLEALIDADALQREYKKRVKLIAKPSASVSASSAETSETQP